MSRIPGTPGPPDPFREGGARPSVRCYVEGCEGRGEHAGVLEMIPAGSQVVRKVRVVLCPMHERLSMVPGARLRLAANPDDLPPDMTLPEGIVL